MYLTCPTCHISVFRRPGEELNDRCPRCHARVTLTLTLPQDPVVVELEAFQVDVSRQGTTAIVSVHGEIDLSNEARLRSAGADAARDAEYVVVDLTDVDFIDSAGIRALIVLRDVVEDSGRMVVVAPPDSPADRLIELCGLSSHLGVVRDGRHELHGHAVG
jgi:anti-sigma B factor antagonist